MPSVTKNSRTTAISCRITRIPREWEEPGEMTIQTISGQSTGGATRKKDQPELPTTADQPAEREDPHQICLSLMCSVPVVCRIPYYLRIQGLAHAKHAPRGGNQAQGPTYAYRRIVCRKIFNRKTMDGSLNPHKNRQGYPCCGRMGWAFASSIGAAIANSLRPHDSSHCFA